MSEQNQDRWARLTLELHYWPNREQILSSRAPLDDEVNDFRTGRPVARLIADVLKFDDPALLGVEFRFLVLARAALLACRSVPNGLAVPNELRAFIRAARNLVDTVDMPAGLAGEDEDPDDDD